MSRNELENSARSAILKYCLSRNFFSNASNCCVVNGVRGFRFGLCLRKLHFNFGPSPFVSVTNKIRLSECEVENNYR